MLCPLIILLSESALKYPDNCSVNYDYIDFTCVVVALPPHSDIAQRVVEFFVSASCMFIVFCDTGLDP